MTGRINLSDIPKSKQMLTQICIADGLTKKTGLEHGFKFYKTKDEVVIDRLCVGSKCSITIKPEKGGTLDASFHTHPNSKRSMFSIGDLYSSVYCSQHSGRSHVTCVKSISDTDVVCIKTDVIENDIDASDIRYLHSEWDDRKAYIDYTRKLHGCITNDLYEKTMDLYEIILTEIYRITRPESIMFNAKTGKISRIGIVCMPKNFDDVLKPKPTLINLDDIRI